MTSRWTAWLVASLLGASGAAAGVGCSATDSSDPKPAGTGEGPCVGCNDPGELEVGALTIEPPSVSLDVVMGQPQSQPFVARADGLDVTSEVTWVFDKPVMGIVVLIDEHPGERADHVAVFERRQLGSRPIDDYLRGRAVIEGDRASRFVQRPDVVLQRPRTGVLTKQTVCGFL